MDTATENTNRCCVSKKALPETAASTRYQICNKIAGKITTVGKSQKKEKEDETEIYIPPEKSTANNR